MLIPKTKMTRSRHFRMWIASLQCAVCKIEGMSQAAHLGKGGMARKGDDYTCVPLCAQSPGREGCHAELDKHLKTDFWKKHINEAFELTEKLKTIYLSESVTRDFDARVAVGKAFR